MFIDFPQALEARLSPILKKSFRIYGRYPIKIRLSNDLGSDAGIAILDKNTIVLNYELLFRNPLSFEEVFTHEISHIIAHQKFKSKSHCNKWKNITCKLGYPGKIFHTMK
tara:strand:- start:2199 stop:2528 length:330 start_codon:yes stop_codon:yes gene_type:complete